MPATFAPKNFIPAVPAIVLSSDSYRWSLVLFHYFGPSFRTSCTSGSCQPCGNDKGKNLFVYLCGEFDFLWFCCLHAICRKLNLNYCYWTQMFAFYLFVMFIYVGTLSHDQNSSDNTLKSLTEEWWVLIMSPHHESSLIMSPPSSWVLIISHLSSWVLPLRESSLIVSPPSSWVLPHHESSLIMSPPSSWVLNLHIQHHKLH